MKLSIYSLQNTLFEGEVDKVTLPTPQGEITVLDNHIPLITLINPGYVRYTPLLTVEASKEYNFSGTQKVIKLSGGVLEVRPQSEVVILAEE